MADNKLRTYVTEELYPWVEAISAWALEVTEKLNGSGEEEASRDGPIDPPPPPPPPFEPGEG